MTTYAQKLAIAGKRNSELQGIAMNACANNHTGTRIRTLVVDDSPFMLKILAQTVEAAGDFDLVGSATDGHQALRYMSTLWPDLVLMDLHMPGLNGIQVTRHVKQSEHPPVVIIVSSDDSSAAKAAAEQAGADGFVSKGSNLRRQILSTLHELFRPCHANKKITTESLA